VSADTRAVLKTVGEGALCEPNSLLDTRHLIISNHVSYSRLQSEEEKSININMLAAAGKD